MMNINTSTVINLLEPVSPSVLTISPKKEIVSVAYNGTFSKLNNHSIYVLFNKRLMYSFIMVSLSINFAAGVDLTLL